MTSLSGSRSPRGCSLRPMASHTSQDSGNHRVRREHGIALLRAIDNRVTTNVACRNEIWDAVEEGGSGNLWTANVFCSTRGI
jgi:hypothetical protein